MILASKISYKVNMNNNREVLWDNLKFFLILCVVAGHFMIFLSKDSDFYKVLQLFFIFIYNARLYFYCRLFPS